MIARKLPNHSSRDNFRLIMTLLVRNEQDILPHVLEYYRSQGVDHFIVTDNLSEDSTPAILDHYKKLGWLTVINENDDDYDQQAWVTRMARMAAKPEFSADWIIHCDADEFWITQEKTLREFFIGIDPSVNIVSASRHDFICLRDDGQRWHESMIYRKRVSLSPKGKPLPPKVAHRPNPDARVVQGNHDVLGFEDPVRQTEGIEILHFPMRSLNQIENKIAKGGAAYQRNTVLPKTVAVGWRRLYEELELKGNLHDHFETNSLDVNDAVELLQKGELIVDERVADFFSRNKQSWSDR